MLRVDQENGDLLRRLQEAEAQRDAQQRKLAGHAIVCHSAHAKTTRDHNLERERKGHQILAIFSNKV